MARPAKAYDLVAVYPPAWEAPAYTAHLQEILDGLELVEIDAAVRKSLQRTLYRYDKHGKLWGQSIADARAHITILLRTVVESEGNGPAAVIEPVLTAVAHVMTRCPKWPELGLAWIEAFDNMPMLQILDTMRSLDLFEERELGGHLGTILINRLRPVLEPRPPLPPPVKPARPPKGKRKVAQRPAA